MKKILVVLLLSGLMVGFFGCASVDEEDPFAGQVEETSITPQYVIDYNKGYNLAVRKNYSEAIKYYLNSYKAIKKLKNDEFNKESVQKIYKTLLLELGRVYGNIGDVANARKYYDEAIKRWPNNIDTYLKYGGILEKNGFTDDAHTLYQKAMSLNPNSAVAEFALADIYKNEGKLDEAIKYYTLGLKKDPNFQDGNGWFKLGKTYEMKNDYDGVIKAYESMVKAKPDYWKSYYYLADAYLTKGLKVGVSGKKRLSKKDRALRVEYYKKAIAEDKIGLGINPNSKLLLNHLANSYLKLAEMYAKTNKKLYSKYANNAIEVLKKFIQADPSSAKGYSLIADAYYKIKKYRKAIEYAKKSLAIEDNDYARSVLGDTYYKLKMWAKAKVQYLKLKDNPNYPYVKGRLKIIELRLRGEY